VNIVYFLLPMALLLGGGFLYSFVISVRKGQYDDLETPAHRMLLDDEESPASPGLEPLNQQVNSRR
jgi:cbb3-type cytochrome oxidase maturation protein